jgi:23S rRNA (pseudouridine1915-N3)-methyltransferase
MKLNIITIGSPKLSYAKDGWQEYYGRLGHYHQIRATRVADKHNDATHILEAAANSYKVALEINGRQFSSPELAAWLDKRALDGRELSLLIGGPDGLPSEVLEKVDLKWSLSQLTLPHDLAMVVLLETLYRASTISAGQPYHK